MRGPGLVCDTCRMGSSAAREMERRSGNKAVTRWSDDLDAIGEQLAAHTVDVSGVGPPLDDRQLRTLVAEVSDRISDTS